MGASVVMEKSRTLPAVRCALISLPLRAAGARDTKGVRVLDDVQTYVSESPWKIRGDVQYDGAWCHSPSTRSGCIHPSNVSAGSARGCATNSSP